MVIGGVAMAVIFSALYTTRWLFSLLSFPALLMRRSIETSQPNKKRAGRTDGRTDGSFTERDESSGAAPLSLSLSL